jgi:hypothetical protein
MLVRCPCQPAAGYDQDCKGDMVESHVEGGDLSMLPACHGICIRIRTDNCWQTEVWWLYNQHQTGGRRGHRLLQWKLGIGMSAS